MFLCVYWSIPGINETNVMAGIAPLKLTRSRCPTTSVLNPQRSGMVVDILPEVLFIVHAGVSAVTTVTIESYTLFPSPLFYIRSC